MGRSGRTMVSGFCPHEFSTRYWADDSIKGLLGKYKDLSVDSSTHMRSQTQRHAPESQCWEGRHNRIFGTLGHWICPIDELQLISQRTCLSIIIIAVIITRTTTVIIIRWMFEKDVQLQLLASTHMYLHIYTHDYIYTHTWGVYHIDFIVFKA